MLAVLRRVKALAPHSSPGRRVRRARAGALQDPFSLEAAIVAGLISLPEEPAEADGDVRAVEVVAQADRLREIRHHVVAGLEADRERAGHVEIDSPAELAAECGTQRIAARDDPRRYEAPLGQPENRACRNGDEGLDRL